MQWKKSKGKEKKRMIRWVNNQAPALGLAHDFNCV
jgi:hypothetical protein